MVLSNAERQERYRQRLKAAARGDDLGSRASAAIDEALAAAWAISKRAGDSSFDGFPDLAALKFNLASDKNPASDLRATLLAFSLDEGGSPDELATISRALSILDAVALRPAETSGETR